MQFSRDAKLSPLFAVFAIVTVGAYSAEMMGIASMDRLIISAAFVTGLTSLAFHIYIKYVNMK